MYSLKNVKNQLVDFVFEACEHLYGAKRPADLPKAFVTSFRLPLPTFKHSLALGCFALRTVVKGVKPAKLASEISEYMMKNLTESKYTGFLESVSHEKVFINFFFKVSYLASSTIPYIESGEFFKYSEPKSENVMVEYSQPNTHKVFHVGHMRNVALGHSIIKMYKHVGYNVISANYIGDVGAHIAKCLWYFEKFVKKGQEKTIDELTPKDVQRVEWLGSMYSSAVKEIDFGSWTYYPFIGTKLAKVISKKPHPTVPTWNVCEVSTSATPSEKDTHVVVCGGTNYEVGDVVGYAPLGSKFKGKDVGVVDKKGVESHGIILGRSELGVTKCCQVCCEQGHDKKDCVDSKEEEIEGEKAEEEEEEKVVDNSKNKKNKKNKKKKKKNKGRKKDMTIQVFKSSKALKSVGQSLVEHGRKERKQVYDKSLKEMVWVGCPLELLDVDLEIEMDERTKGWKNILTRLEEKDEYIFNLWKKTRQWSLEDFGEIYDWIGAEFDHFYYESEVEEPSKKYIHKLLEEGVMVKSHGAVGMDLSKYKLGFAMALTTAGNGLYLTKDLELARIKFENYKIDKSLYVVDIGQSHHFKQVFKTLELLGFNQAKNCCHIAYGLVTLPSGKMSSRYGSIIPFSALKSEISDAIRKEYFDLSSDKITAKKREMVEKLTESEINHMIHIIAQATIRYGMLNQDNNKQIVFKMDQWVGTKGNTGPYILYAYTRIRSIGRKNEASVSSEEYNSADWRVIPEPCRFVIQKMTQFQDKVEEAAETNKPMTLCVYLFQLCQMFSTVYEADGCSVTRAKDIKVKAVLLRFYKAIAAVLKKGIELLGMETLEFM